MPPTPSHEPFPTLIRARNAFSPHFPHLPEMGISHEPPDLQKQHVPAHQRGKSWRQPRVPGRERGSEGAPSRRDLGASRLAAAADAVLDARWGIWHRQRCCRDKREARKAAWAAGTPLPRVGRRRGGGDGPHAAPGTRAANAATAEITCRGSKAGNLGFPPQK